MKEPKIFTHPEFGKLCAITIANEPWFMGTDVLHAVGYARPVRPKQVINVRLLPTEHLKEKVNIKGRTTEAHFINVVGLHRIVAFKDSEVAYRFERWIESYVIPSIRKSVPEEAKKAEKGGEDKQGMGKGNEAGHRTFNYHGIPISTFKIENEIWFAGADAAKAAGYKELNDVKNAVFKYVCEADMRMKKDTSEGMRKMMLVVNESGLYDLILNSELFNEEKKEFLLWVTHEVLLGTKIRRNHREKVRADG